MKGQKKSIYMYTSGTKWDLSWIKGLGMPEDPECLFSGEESDL